MGQHTTTPDGSAQWRTNLCSIAPEYTKRTTEVANGRIVHETSSSLVALRPDATSSSIHDTRLADGCRGLCAYGVGVAAPGVPDGTGNGVGVGIGVGVGGASGGGTNCV